MTKVNISLQHRLLIWVLLMLGGITPLCFAAETKQTFPWNGKLLAELVGSWDGVGTVYGNEVTLERMWSLELAGQFLRADMRVKMSNGNHFRALTFWRTTGNHKYHATWMDETGKSQSLEGIGDPARKEVVIHHMEEGFGGPPEWRRIVYRLLGADTYLELLYTETGEGWKQIGEFKFSRKKIGAAIGAATSPRER